MAVKKPTEEQIVRLLKQGKPCTSSRKRSSYSSLMATIQSDFLTEFTNAIEQRYNDTHSKQFMTALRKANKATLQAVVYEKSHP